MFSSANGLVMRWRRLGNLGTTNIPSEEQAQSRDALAGCVDLLESTYRDAPRESVQAAQLLQCMRDRGWHLVLDEFVIISGA